MDTEPKVEELLLHHAQRQTKALENINWVVMALFVLFLFSAGVWAIGALG